VLFRPQTKAAGFIFSSFESVMRNYKNFNVSEYILCVCVCVCMWKHTDTLYNPTVFNRLTPNDPYMSCTAPLTSKRSILYIYSTNIGTEYFKHALKSPFFLFKMQFVS
jgi:hypothetical protein